MIITIARQCGSGGLVIGETLAARFGLPLYTKQSLTEMARRRSLTDRLSDFLDEHPVDSLLFAITQSDGMGHVTEHTRNAMASLVGDTGGVVIGRCGNFIFGDRPDCVSLFLKGDRCKRVEFIAAYNSLPPQDAADFVDRNDESRRAYHSYYTGQTWGLAANYDLCLDSNRLGFDRAVDLIVDYVDAVAGRAKGTTV